MKTHILVNIEWLETAIKNARNELKEPINEERPYIRGLKKGSIILGEAILTYHPRVDPKDLKS